MNSIRQIQELNKRELENGVYVPYLLTHTLPRLTTCSSPDASWHADYRDTAYIYIGGLPFELSEGDIITIFSQFGEPVYINLIRDKETGKSKGFAFLKYEDQRSTDLAVDNLGGSVIMGRTLKVDHTRYKKKDDVEDEGIDLTAIGNGGDRDAEGRRKRRKMDESASEEERPIIKEERELAKLIQEHDDDDPMKAFLIEDKKEEIKIALARSKGEKSGKSSESKSKHRHHHGSRREKDDRKDGDERRSRHRKDEHKSSRRSRSSSRNDFPPRPKEREERKPRDRRGKIDDSIPKRRGSPSYERSGGWRESERSIPRKRSPSPRDREYDGRKNHSERRRSRSRS
jgi:RNA-binding motif X-linked protein 2